MYKMRFWFEHSGSCLWADDAETAEKFDYSVKVKNLPVSDATKDMAEELEKEFRTILDWNDPGTGYIWSNAHKADFENRANILYKRLVEELGDQFVIINDVKSTL